MVHLWWEESLWLKLTATASHLKLGASFANLVNVGQRASVVRRPRLGQAELLDLLKLHLPSKEKPLTDSEIINPTQNFAQELTSGASYVSFHVSAGEVCVTRGVCETRGVPTWTACTHTRWLTGLFHMQVTSTPHPLWLEGLDSPSYETNLSVSNPASFPTMFGVLKLQHISGAHSLMFQWSLD